MELTSLVKTALPFLATALGGPLAGAAVEFVSSQLGIPAKTVDDVKALLNGVSTERLQEFRAADQEFRLKLVHLGYDSLAKIEEINASVVREVNKTMQEETRAEHWPTYSWRPFIGAQFGFYIMSLWLLPLFKVTPVIMNPDIVLAIGGILGVASYFRGKAQADPNVPTPPVGMKG